MRPPFGLADSSRLVRTTATRPRPQGTSAAQSIGAQGTAGKVPDTVDVSVVGVRLCVSVCATRMRLHVCLMSLSWIEWSIDAASGTGSRR